MVCEVLGGSTVHLLLMISVVLHILHNVQAEAVLLVHHIVNDLHVLLRIVISIRIRVVLHLIRSTVIRLGLESGRACIRLGSVGYLLRLLGVS